MTTLHRSPPFRAEHLGSLLRPENLLQAGVALDDGSIQQKQLAVVEDGAVKGIVDLQINLGFCPISDGEYRRHSMFRILGPAPCTHFEIVFWGTFFPGMDGFEEIQNINPDIFRYYMPDIAAFLESGHKPGESVVCTGKIKHVGSTYLDQWEYLKNLVPKDKIGECKLTLAAPNWYYLSSSRIDQSPTSDKAKTN